MKFKSKSFHIIWLVISIVIGLLLIKQIFPQEIHLPKNVFNLNSINKVCNGTENCTVSLPANESSDISLLSKQFESFDNFFPLSAIARLNLRINYSLDSNAYLEITYPEYSKKITKIKISCANESLPRFDSDKSEKVFNKIRLASVGAIVTNYFICEKPRVELWPEEEHLVVGPNQYVKIVTQGDGVAITQESSIFVDSNFLTKLVIFIVILFISMGAGTILFVFLKALDLIVDREDKSAVNRYLMTKANNTNIDVTRSFMNTTNRSIENLSHFRCKICNKWWSVGDALESKTNWWCPWCGKESVYKIEKRT